MKRIFERVLVGVAVALCMTAFFWVKKAYAYPATLGSPTTGGCYGMGTAFPGLSTPQAVCNAGYTAQCEYYDQFTGNPYVTQTTPGSGTYTCKRHYVPSNIEASCGTLQCTTDTPGAYTCPGGGTLAGSTCTCAQGQTDTGTACQSGPTDCTNSWPKVDNNAGGCACPGSGQDPYLASTFTNGQLNEASWAAAGTNCGTNRPSTACVGGGSGSGCQMTVNWDAANHYGRSGSTCFGTYAGHQLTFTGSGCSSATPTDIPNQADANDQQPCAPGMVGGTVNGIFRCLPGNTQGSGSSTGTTETTLPDGTTIERETTEERVTNCSGPGSCSTTITTTTTTTTTVPGQSPTTTTEETTETKPGDGTEIGAFCEQNPGSPICKSSAWSGACAAVSCEGDAIQCAIAREQHKRNCEMLNPRATGGTPAEAGTFYDANSKGEGIAKGLIHTDGTLPTMDQTSRGLSGAGLTDVSYSIGSMGSITVPYSNVNNILNIIGNIVLALALIIGARIFYNGAVS